MIDIKNCLKGVEGGVLSPFIQRSVALLNDNFHIDAQNIKIKKLESSEDINEINFLSYVGGTLDINLIFSFEREFSKYILDSTPYVEYEEDEEEEMIFETSSEFLNYVLGHVVKDLKQYGGFIFSTPIELSGQNRYIHAKNKDACKIKVITEQGSVIMIFSKKIKE